jgi:hypothetical protein
VIWLAVRGKELLAIALFVSLAGFRLVATAAPVNYDERTEGDLADGPYTDPRPTLHFDYGNNHFQGTSIIDFTSPNTADQIVDGDYIRFVLPGPARVTIRYQALSDPFPGTDSLKVGFDMLPLPLDIPGRPPSLCPVFIPCVEANLLEQAPQAIASDLVTDWPEWYFTDSFKAARRGASGAGGGGTWIYSLSFQVNPIQEPSMLALVGLALVGLCFSRRRQCTLE